MYSYIYLQFTYISFDVSVLILLLEFFSWVVSQNTTDKFIMEMLEEG